MGLSVASSAPFPDWETCLQLARTAEDLGFDSFWQGDHPGVSADCWVTLGALATHTRRIRLGPLVACAYYRPPALLARQAADVDRLSHGRLALGVGSGWVEDEFRLLGLPFPPVAERQRMLRETIRAVRGLWAAKMTKSATPVEGATRIATTAGPWWSTRPFTYNGQLTHFDRAGQFPGPVQRPRVPLVVGGNGEHSTFRLVARYGDMANIQDSKVKSREEVRAKVDVLRTRFDEVGRAFDSVIASYFSNGVVVAETSERVEEKLAAVGRRPHENAGTPEQIIARFRPIVDAGLNYLVMSLAAYDDLETVELLAERVLPELQPR
jgi:alkanesulfonate monooxygenase SsuD/methylene tetrahydromethanopterin reductase-like flavin-dependent oxidoreductase (luciferase family)